MAVLKRLKTQCKSALLQGTVAAAAAAGPGPGTSASSSSSSSNSLMADLKRLNTQCKVYKRSGQELGQDEDEEVTGALGMALELSSLSRGRE
eukprot:gene32108-16624_t